MISSISKYIRIALIAIFVGLVITVFIQHRNNKNLKKQVSVAVSNEKALFAEADSLKSTKQSLQFTIQQLRYFNDSINTKLLNAAEELDKKDKDIKQLQYQLTQSTRIDTVVFRDTLFKDPTVKLDTTLGDKWYTVNLGLRYPSTIIVHPTFNNEAYTIFSYKKETIKPPKKFFLWRWFQRKQQIVEVNVIQKNPYTKNKEQRFIDIID